MDKYDSLKLGNQLCFPLYAAAKEITRKYKPFLDELDLTYTQYICMMVMWEHKSLNVKKLGEYIYLDSGTLTPLLKKLEEKGYIERNKNLKDERNLTISITDKGLKLRDKALSVPKSMGSCISLNPEEATLLYKVLYKILNNLDDNKSQE
ncbi:MAG: MarR family transcriptional regulator [Acholeplasmatales bacterium]|nr:MarR family transcriptional regulator [Acholeplasmatales bacterium]